MIYLFMLIGVILITIGIIQYKKAHIKYSDDGYGFIMGGIVLLIISILAFIITICHYNNIASTASYKLEVLEEQNKEILTQVEPVVKEALKYESTTYSNLKIDADRLIAVGQMYPDLKNNTFIQTQLNVIISNQQEIKQLKLQKASLNAYRLWILTKKWEYD